MAKQNETASITFEADISQFTKSISQMNKDIKLINSQFDVSASEMDDWASSSDGLKLKIDSLVSVLEKENQKLSDITNRRNEYQSTLNSNKKKLDELETAYQQIVASEGESSENAKKLIKQKRELEKAIARNEKSLHNEELALNKQKIVVNNTSKSIKNYETQLEELNTTLEDTEEKTDDTTESSGKFRNAMKSIGKGLAAGIVAIGAAAATAAKSFLDLAESTREYRIEMGKLETNSNNVNANFEETKKAYQELVAVTRDEGAATEAISNLLTAGFKGNELDEITNYLQGAAIQWKDTLKAEGLSDSLQEWIGSEGASLSGQFAELLERLGYNLDKVKSETAGFTAEQQRAYAIDILRKNGLGEIADAYKEENKVLYEASIAQQILNDKTAVLGEAADKITTILKTGLASILTKITPFVLELSSAFETLLKGNIDEGFEKIGNTFEGVFGKVTELVPKVVTTVSEILPNALSNIITWLSQAIQKILGSAPQIAEAASTLVSALVESVGNGLTTLVKEIPNLLDSLLPALTEIIPTILELTNQLTDTLLNDILPGLIDSIVEVLPELVTSLTNFIQENIPVLLEQFGNLLGTLVEAIPNLIDKLVDALPTIIGSIVDFIMENLPTLLDAGQNLFNQIIAAIPVMLVNLIAKLPTIISAIIETLLANGPKIFALGFDLFMNFVSAIPKMIIELVKKLPDIIDAIKKGFKNAPTVLKEAGKDVIRGLADGIDEMKAWLQKKLESAADWLPKWVKDKLGIASPSKVFAEIGKFSADGLGIGFTNEMKKVKKSITNAVEMDDVTLGSKANINAIDNNNNSINNTPNKNITLNYTVNSPTALSQRQISKNAEKMISRLRVVGGI